MYQCEFCGFESDQLNNFEPDEQLHKGFWCPYCDGFTYYKDQSHRHNFVLMLENASGSVQNQITYPKPDFRTQVSPLRYPGGKSKFVGQIMANCNPDNMVNFVEPFAGGASVGLSLLLAGKIQNLYLNDADFGIYSLFFTIKHFPQILAQRIKSFTPSEKAFRRAKYEVSEGFCGLDTTEAAWNTLIVNRLAFSGIPKANCMSNPSARWNADALIKRIMDIHHHSERIFVSNMDACEYIEEMYWMPATTLFIDPPYFVKGKSLYNLYYTDDDHRKLSFLLDELYKGMPGADMVITYDYCQEIEALYYYPTVEVINRKYCIAN